MNSRNIFIAILLLIVVACNRNIEKKAFNDKTEKKTLDLGVFKLTVPANWTKFEERGIDTYVGGITNGKDTLHYGYGLYNEDISEFSEEKMRYAADVINGYRANIGLSEAPGHVAVMIMNVNQGRQFIMDGYNLSQPDVVLGIFRSVVFKGSDVSKNRNTPIDSFNVHASASGKSLFRMNCMSCHSFHKEVTGPALNERGAFRDNQWLYKFLANRSSVSADTGQVSLKKKYGFECPDFSSMSEEECWALIEYIRAQ